MNELDTAKFTKLLEGFGSFAPEPNRNYSDKVRLICECQNNSLPREFVSVLEIAGNLGLKVYESELTEDVSGMLDCGARKIYLKGTDSVTRKRFTCAHEIGHFLLHDRHDVVLLRSSSAGEIEKEADGIAAEILMPRYFVGKFVKEDGKHLADLAKKFKVSELAIECRLSSLGI